MQTPQKRFWIWFEAHEHEILDFEADQERIFDSILVELNRISPHLTFEFGPKSDPREFVISADGIKDAFPHVVSLVASAPKLERWRITAFRPRRTPLNSVQIGDISVEPNEIEFSLITNGSVVGIQLFIPNFIESNVALRQIGYLLLDDALGEYDVETYVGPIQMYPFDSPRTATRYPFEELPSLFDQLVASLRPPTLPN